MSKVSPMLPLAAMPLLLLFLLMVTATGGVPVESPKTCAPKSCPAVDSRFYTVHIVPHSHMDLGWLKTVEQYFFGTNARITPAGVQYIYDSVLNELERDPLKRFMFVETGFFQLWWDHRDNKTRETFKRLVLNGQIELVSGGYVMNDEAATHYMNTIDQMSYGLAILKEIFGECGVSRIGWQIDPFGHSREFASLLAQMGYEGLFLGRIDYQDKAHREAALRMEFRWQASEFLPNASLTGVVLANTYSPPPGFCFDEFCNDEVIVEDPEAEEFNGPTRAKDLIRWLTIKASYYATNNFLVTMGNDFNYQNAHKWMSNLDALMRLINGKGFKINGLPVRLVYSTPSCYLSAVEQANRTRLVVKTDDFFPYASDPHAYWTGYFTSRPAFKYFDRLANNWFQAVKQLSAMAGLGSGRLGQMRRALAIAQHHDAVTGTAKQHVNNDYTRMLSIGLSQTERVTVDALETLAANRTHSHKERDYDPRDQPTTGDERLVAYGIRRRQHPSAFVCRTLNVSACDELDQLVGKTAVDVVAYNPFSQKVRSYLRIPVVLGNSSSSGEDTVNYNTNGKEAFSPQAFAVFVSNEVRREQSVQFDVLPISDGVKHLAERTGKATHEVVFPVDIEPLSFTSAKIVPRPALLFPSKRIPWSYQSGSLKTPYEISRGGTRLLLDPARGLVGLRMNGVETVLQHGFFFYPSHAGNNTAFSRRASGAYIFRPGGKARELQHISQEVIQGRTITEVRSRYADWVYETLRLTDKGEVEFDWIVGPIPIEDNLGKELVWRLYTDIESGSEFFTDSNGRETIRRVRKSGPTLTEPVSGNYYPVNTLIAINDTTRHLAILTDRSQGGSSLASGQIELMMHRRCLFDDAFGVGEALNETGFNGRGLQVRGTYRLLLQPSIESGNQLRPQALQMALRPIVAFSEFPLLPKQSLINASALPEGAYLLSLEEVANKVYLVRLEHMLELKDRSKSLTVNLQKLFNGRVRTVRETLLAGNVDLDKAKSCLAHENCSVELHPMQIRTFYVTTS